MEVERGWRHASGRNSSLPHQAMEDMSKFFLAVSRLPSETPSTQDMEPPRKRAKGSSTSPSATQVIFRGGKHQPTKMAITRSLSHAENDELPVEFEPIDMLSPSKWPLGMMRSARLHLHDWKRFRMHGIPPHALPSLHEGAAALTVACANLQSLAHVKRFVRHRSTLLESFRQTQPPEFQFPIPRSPWSASMPEVAQVVAGALAVRPLTSGMLCGADLIRKTSCPPDMIARCLGILQGMGMVRAVPPVRAGEQDDMLRRRYEWCTEGEVVWMDLPFFVSLLLTLQQQRAILRQCVRQAVHQLQLQGGSLDPDPALYS